ncbi:MerR family transcriptional regulator [Streptomyces sp. NPDC000594]|uniref:MerR family transcriptional regulator n=1 Tax=Streptomyces sp. NPDC000594 TaxID=3154261 RepID=UPI0033338641
MVNETTERLSIGAFATRSRLSAKALRLYDRLGLLVPERVDRSTGYRWYGAGQVDRARLVALLRRLDMPLARIAELVELPDEPAAEALAGFWSEAEERFAAQRAVAVFLQNRLSGKGQDMFQVDVMETEEHVVLTERRRLLADELPRWIPAACERLRAAAEQCGGVPGLPFVVYHAEVSEESDGPAEVCMPVRDRAAAEAYVAGLGASGGKDGGKDGGTQVRTEPPRRLVYTRITKEQMVYPRILSAYHAVDTWAAEQGLTCSGPGREIYFAHWESAAPTDPVCDIAIPVS